MLLQLLKIALAAGVLLIFAGTGVAHILYPDWFLARSGVRKGGEMLTDLNRKGFRLLGLIFTGMAIYMLYYLLKGVIADYKSGVL